LSKIKKLKFMKKYLFLALVSFSTLSFAQAYKGKGDFKLQLGALIQDGGTGMVATTDYGIGENMSVGLSASYMLNAQTITAAGVTFKPEFLDRADIKARFNANLGNVFQLEDNMDIYPGLDFGTRNFGAHLGFRYFFTDGFGVYSELQIPIATYEQDPVGFDKFNNQFNAQIGISFNL
jgi:hypothetical protein